MKFEVDENFIDPEKLIIWINKKDLENIETAYKKIMDVYSTEVIYGQCFILSKDISIEKLKEIFKYDWFGQV